MSGTGQPAADLHRCEQAEAHQTAGQWLVSAYTALAGVSDPALRNACLAGIADLPGAGGFEVPLRPDGSLDDLDWIVASLRPDWAIALTVLPATMRALKDDPDFGLASARPASRHAAIQQARTARDAVARLSDLAGREVVTAVLFPSAPNRGKCGSASAAAFFDSVQEIVSWDWQNAAVLVEHCDAHVEGQSTAKGFLDLADEIQAVQAAQIGGGASAGISINWARSVIETRAASGAMHHLRAATDAGVLAGLAFSGCASTTTTYGDAWVDAHLPLAPDPRIPSRYTLPESLLTRQHIQATLRLASTAALHLRCVKVTAPREAVGADRIGLVAAYLNTLTAVDVVVEPCGNRPTTIP